LKSIRIINANASRSTAQRGLTFLSRLSEGFPSLSRDHRQHQEGAAQTGLCLPAGFTFNRQTITVEDHFAKNGETRTVPLNSAALDTLKVLKGRFRGGYL